MNYGKRLLTRAQAASFIMALGLLGSVSASAEKPAKHVIDLGVDETQGSVRKPQLRVVESQATVNLLLPDVYRGQFEAIESELTRPSAALVKQKESGQ